MTTITQDILNGFTTYGNAPSDISSTEIEELSNAIYYEILNERPWWFLRQTDTGTLSTSVPYIALPADFREMAINQDGHQIVYVGSTREEYKVIPMNQREKYRDMSSFCYIDYANSRMVFTLQPTIADSYEYDYINTPSPLKYDPLNSLNNVDPLFPNRYKTMVVHGMVANYNIIDESDKMRAYRQENMQKYGILLNQLRLEDGRIQQTWEL